MLLQTHQEAQSIKNKKGFIRFFGKGKKLGWINCCLIQRTDLELHSMHNYYCKINQWAAQGSEFNSIWSGPFCVELCVECMFSPCFVGSLRAPPRVQ